MTTIVVLIVAGIATWMLHASFILPGRSGGLPQSADNLLVFVRPAVLGALAANAVMGVTVSGGTLAFGPATVAVVGATAIATVTRNLALTLCGSVLLFAVLENFPGV